MWRSLKISQEAAMQQLLCIDSFKGQVELYVAPNHPLLILFFPPFQCSCLNEG